jgi:hypothetical protein
MIDTIDPMATDVDQQELAQFLAQAKEQGIELVGPDGRLSRLTKNVLASALDAEMVPKARRAWAWEREPAMLPKRRQR